MNPRTLITRISAFIAGIALAVSAYAGPIWTAFSPDGGAENMVIRVISSAKSNIRMAAYSFTSPKIMKALIDARKRGVDVKIIIDERNNRSDASHAAMNLVVNAGIDLRVTDRYKIHHDKYIVVDGVHTETGSYNYTNAAAKSNSENVIVVWNDSGVAKSYLNHWQSRWNTGWAWTSSY